MKEECWHRNLRSRRARARAELRGGLLSSRVARARAARRLATHHGSSVPGPVALQLSQMAGKDAAKGNNAPKWDCKVCLAKANFGSRFRCRQCGAPWWKEADTEKAALAAALREIEELKKKNAGSEAASTEETSEAGKADDADKKRKEAEEKFVESYANMAEAEWSEAAHMVAPALRHKIAKSRAKKDKDKAESETSADPQMAWRQALRKEQELEKKLEDLKKSTKSASDAEEKARAWLQSCQQQLQEKQAEQEQAEREVQEAQAKSIQLHIAAKGRGAEATAEPETPAEATKGVQEFMQPIANKLNTLGVYNSETAKLWDTVVGALRALEKVCDEKQADSGNWCADAAASAEGFAKEGEEQAAAREQEEIENWANTFEKIMAVDGPVDLSGANGDGDGAVDPLLLQRWKTGKATKTDAKNMAKRVLGNRAFRKTSGGKQNV